MKTVTTEECTCGTVPQVRLVNTSGAAVTLGGIGAAIMAVEVPDRNGKLADVTIGYADTADYMADGPAAGKIPGGGPASQYPKIMSRRISAREWAPHMAMASASSAFSLST